MPRRIVFLTLAALLVCAALFAACGGDDDASSTPTAAPSATASSDTTIAAAEQFMLDLVTTYNSGDIQGFIDSFSDTGILEFNGDDPSRPAADARAEILQNSGGGDTVTFRAFSDESTSGDITTLTFDSVNGAVINREIFGLKKTGDSFLIDSYAPGDPPIPDGVTALGVEGTEYQYILDDSKVTAGQQAFTFSNIGSQFHELRLLKVDDTTPAQQIVDDALAVEDPSNLPPDIEADVGAGYAAPGQTTNVVFAEPLAAGRYVLICFIPDDGDNQPHAAHGMFHEINIP